MTFVRAGNFVETAKVLAVMKDGLGIPHVRFDMTVDTPSKIRLVEGRAREKIGEYQAGSDALADQAIQSRAAMLGFLSQAPESAVAFDKSIAALRRFMG